MTPATLLALLSVAAPPDAPSARVYLKMASASAPACRTARVDGNLVSAPLFSPTSAKCPVANVAGATIPLGDLAATLEGEHLMRPRRHAAGKAPPSMDFTPALDRLITLRLVEGEVRDMRLDQTPEFRKTVDQYRAARLRAMVQQIAARGVKPDPAEVRRLYREAVREWKITAVLLEKEADAKAFEAALRGGQRFDAALKKLVAEKKAKGGKAEWASAKHMLPEVVAAVEKAKPGVPTPLLKVPLGWTVLRVDAIRYPSRDKGALATARAQSQARLEREAVRRFYVSLVAKYAKVDEPLLQRLDLEAGGEQGFEALGKDTRPLATIAGEAPLTVADLAREIGMKFFHGLATPIQEHRVNREKADTFEKLLGARLFAKEAKARKLDQRPDYLRQTEEYERATAFSTFIDKVILPDVKVSEQEATRYYDQHKGEFTAPQMYKLDAMAFPTTRDAQTALDKLNAGTDFSWLRTSAPGQIPPERRSLGFEGHTVSANMLPPELAKALTGASPGDYRLYAAKPDEVYVVRVTEQMASAPQPYAEAREAIVKKLFNEKVTRGVNDYAAKLRQAQPVDVLITRVSM